MSANIVSSEATLLAENTFTDPVEIQWFFNLNVSGTWIGTITVQRKFQGDSTWRDVPSGVFTENVDRVGFEPENGVLYRAGFKTGDYISGSAKVRISR